METRGRQCTAFVGTRRIAGGRLADVALAAKAAMDADGWAQVLIFDDLTSAVVEVDLRGSAEDVFSRLVAEPGEESTRRPGRPKLGVVAREVTLLPRHWEWLAQQPGGASVALRKLVEQASRANRDQDRRRRAVDAAYRFMSAMAGNLPGFEEAARALFGDRPAAFGTETKAWPPDVRDHARMLASRVFQQAEGEDS